MQGQLKTARGQIVAAHGFVNEARLPEQGCITKDLFTADVPGLVQPKKPEQFRQIQGGQLGRFSTKEFLLGTESGEQRFVILTRYAIIEDLRDRLAKQPDETKDVVLASVHR
jgi:hypothetical protein